MVSCADLVPGYDTFTAWDIKQYDNDQFQLDGRNVDLDQTSGGAFGQWGIAPQTVSDFPCGNDSSSSPC
jgi:hypothetical protein